MIQREDPDIIIGYNIFGFDYKLKFKLPSRFAQESPVDRYIGTYLYVPMYIVRMY